jgi:hypothetical protein
MAHFENVRTSQPPAEIEELRSVVTAINEPPPPKVEEHTQPAGRHDTADGHRHRGLGQHGEARRRPAGHGEDHAAVGPAAAGHHPVQPAPDGPAPDGRASGESSTSTSRTRSTKARRDREDDRAGLQLHPRQRPGAARHALLVIDTEGGIESIKLMRASANKEFDKIVTECVKEEWVFSPAVRHGKKVRCMVQQLVWYKWTGGRQVLTIRMKLTKPVLLAVPSLAMAGLVRADEPQREPEADHQRVELVPQGEGAGDDGGGVRPLPEGGVARRLEPGVRGQAPGGDEVRQGAAEPGVPVHPGQRLLRRQHERQGGAQLQGRRGPATRPSCGAG